MLLPATLVLTCGTATQRGERDLLTKLTMPALQVLSIEPDDVEVLFLAFDGPARWLPRASRRIWHGTRDRTAWEVPSPLAYDLVQVQHACSSNSMSPKQHMLP